jgi:hypothetical protein
MLLFVAAPLLLSGCYSYHVTQLDDMAPGAGLRLRISPAEAERLVDLRLTEDRLVQGTLVSNGGAAVLIDTEVGVNDAVRGTRALTQRISVQLAEVREIEERRLDRFKTGALVGAVALGVGISAAAALGGGNGGDVPPDPGTGELRVPLRFFGWRLPFGF